MFVRRLTTSFKEQHWTTISIELVIVIIGVFVGNQVSNWNEARIQRHQTEQMLEQIVPELNTQTSFFEAAKAYFATTRRYAAEALGAWNGNRNISDNQFVIDAYQASQIFGNGIDSQAWGMTFGGQQLRDIDDVRLRRHLALVLTSDYSIVGLNAVATPYRQHVREIIPTAAQDQIRTTCGDRLMPGTGIIYALHATCDLKLDPALAHSAATALRAHPELAGELNWHLATVATYLQNADGLERQMVTLKHDIEERSRARR